jgi:hypothetical protein
MEGSTMRAAALVLGLGFLTVGCGGGSQGTGAKSAADSTPMAESAPSGFGAYPAQTPPAAEAKSADAPASAGGASPAPASPSRAERKDSAAEASRAPRPTERPGLGTEWGETRRSRIREVGFDRQSDDPTAVVSLNYNDREGARALASFHDARPISSNSFSALGGAIRVAIEGDDGGSLQSFRVGDRSVVVGTAGQRYSIVLTNRTGRRFETVASVDGLDVISGRPASFDQRGYVLLPFATLRIEGFRQSERAVAAFRFSRVADSYAAQTGSARNVGVIGIAFFRERGDSGIDENELELRDSATPFPAETNRFARPPR